MYIGRLRARSGFIGDRVRRGDRDGESEGWAPFYVIYILSK
jgi:hypothetical protein